MPDDSPDEVDSGAALSEGQASTPVAKVSRPRRMIIGGTFVAAVAALVLVGIWASIPQADNNSEFTTTTDPFAHIDRNQTLDEASSEANTTAPVNAVASESTAQPSEADWDYGSTFDQVRGGTIYRATIDSKSVAYFSPPYEGGSTLTMTVRRHPEYGDDVIFHISKGQFVCGIEDCAGTINFGAGPQTLSLSESTDNSSDTLFASNGGVVIEQLKRAKRIVVELPFYQEGNRQFVFQLDHVLSWPPQSAPTPDAVPEDQNSTSDD